MALFESGKLGPEHCMLFADALSIALGCFELFAKRFERLLAFGPLGVLLFGKRQILGPFRMGALFFTLQAFKLEARDGNARVGPIGLFARTAQVVIERDRVFFARLLKLAETFQLSFEPGGLALQCFLLGVLRFEQAFLLSQLRGVFPQFTLKHQRAA